MEAENKYGRALKGAPSDSLFAQFCLHALWFGNCNIRGSCSVLNIFNKALVSISWTILMIDFVMAAIAVLWIDFVREIRWCWEESERLPRMKTTSSIDLSACVIHQKLQMVLVLISLKPLLNDIFSHTRISRFCLRANVTFLCCPVSTGIMWNRVGVYVIHGIFICLVTLISNINSRESHNFITCFANCRLWTVD